MIHALVAMVAHELCDLRLITPLLQASTLMVVVVVVIVV